MSGIEGGRQSLVELLSTAIGKIHFRSWTIGSRAQSVSSETGAKFMKLLALSRYGRLGASSRLRTYQYIPWFEKSGIELQLKPLLGDEYVRSLYRNKRAVAPILMGYLARVRSLLASRQFDAVYLEQEALPWLPAVLELGLLPRDVRLIIDIDDAVFHNYDLHSNSAVRALLGQKLDRLMARADVVTAGNSYLADRAIKAGCRRVEAVPTVIDLERYVLRPQSANTADEVVIGWIGSPATAKYLGTVSEVLDELRGEHEIRCVAIGARSDQLVGTPFESQNWHEDTEVSSLRSLDIGIMPLPDSPWERGKCGYKLIQYMACGLPVIASPVGANNKIVCHGESGFLAPDRASWTNYLKQLILDSSMRTQMGAVGRQRVEREYCLQVYGPKLTRLLFDVITN
jgi:glycosyltransferase involved in cell wall biosynthesis